MGQRSTQGTEFPMVSNTSKTTRFDISSKEVSRFSMRTTIMFWFLVISLIPLVFVSLLGYHNAVQSRVEDYTVRLKAVSQAEKSGLKNHFEKLQTGLVNQAGNAQTFAMLDRFEENQGHSEASRHEGRLLKKFQVESDIDNIILTNQLGDVVFSCDSQQDIGPSFLLPGVGDPHLNTIIWHVLKTGKRTFSGFKPCANQAGRPLAHHVEPIMGSDGDVRGLLIMELGVDVFDRAASCGNQIDSQIMFYVVDEDLQLLVAPEQLPEIRILETPVATTEILAWQHHLELAEKDSNQERLFHEVKEYSGQGGADVLGVIQDLEVLGTRFALVLELPRIGILAGLKHMGLSLVFMIALVAFLVLVAAVVVTNRMVDPINQLGHAMQRVADGHEVWALPQRGPREICRLTHMFHCMISKLTDAQKMNEKQYLQKRCQFELNEILRGENTLQAMSEAALNYLGEYFGAQSGVFYLVEKRDTYRMTAQFGLHQGEKQIDDVHLGRGVVGRVVAQKQIKVLRGIKDSRHKLETGLVRSFVNNLVLAPIQVGDRVLAVLELGIMEDVEDEALEFLELVSEMVAGAINSARSRERVHRLLKETWSQAATLSKNQKDLLESNRRLELADQYKSEFLANMSHELRTPLNSLLIMSQVLAENRHNNLSRDEVDSAMTINRAGSDLLLLINDILDLSRVEMGKLNINFAKFELKSLLLDMEDLFAPLASEQGVRFRTIMGPELPKFVISDHLRLNQILKNILNNAFKFTEKGSVTFRVRISAPGELAELDVQGSAPWLVFSVADTGVGMSNTTEEQIFEAFNQGDGSIGRRFGGSGLGLSISKKLSDLLGGRILVKSIEGKGSTFSLYLPEKPPVEINGELELENPIPPLKGIANADLIRELEPEAEHQIDMTNKRVLVCEDDMRTVFQISEILDELGAEVTLAPSWAQGVAEASADQNFEFAIVGNRLADRPDSNSLSAWKKEAGHPAFPVLALILAEDGSHCEGADLTGTRPLIRDQFRRLIGKALTTKEAQLLP